MLRMLRRVGGLLLVLVLLGGWMGATFAEDGLEEAGKTVGNDGRVLLYDPTVFSQVLLNSGDSATGYLADLPINSVVVGGGRREFLLGKKWYEVGDKVLGRWVVDDISSERLILRSQDDRNSVWMIRLDAGSGQVVKSYRE